MSIGSVMMACFFLLENIYLFIWLHCFSVWCPAPSICIAACEIFSCGLWTLSHGMWDLVPGPGLNPAPLHWEHKSWPLGHQRSPNGPFFLLQCCYFEISLVFINNVARDMWILLIYSRNLSWSPLAFPWYIYFLFH